MSEKATQFKTETDFEQALLVLEAFNDIGPFYFDLLGDHTIVYPLWAYKKATEAFTEAGIPFETVAIRHLSELPLEEQQEIWANRLGKKVD